MDAHTSEYVAAVNGMAEVYGTDADNRPLAEGMAVVTTDGPGWVEWVDEDRVVVCTERRAWIAYRRCEVRRAAT
jgi:hypothetical protein